MLFVVTDRWVAIDGRNDDTKCPQVILFDVNTGVETRVDIDVSQLAVNGDDNNTTAKSVPAAVTADNDYQILCGAFSQSGDYLCVCGDRKDLVVFEKVVNDWRQVLRARVARNCIRVLFAANKKSIICGHKSGDVFELDLTSIGGDGQQISVSPKPLLGHCSMLLDLMQTNDSKYLITADRDEKIRVSRYPNTYHIESYCLGHKEFVSSIAAINVESIVSGSGDGSIRLWNVSSGQQLHVLMSDPNETIDTNAKTGTQFPVKKLVTNCGKSDANLLCVSFYKQSVVKVFSIDSLSLKLIHTLTLAEEPIDIVFDWNQNHVLWVVLPEVDNAVKAYKISTESITQTDIYDNIIKQINCNQSFQTNCVNESKANVLDGLYKHWFNNVETYLQKKLERKQEMTKKKKFCRL